MCKIFWGEKDQDNFKNSNLFIKFSLAYYRVNNFLQFDVSHYKI